MAECLGNICAISKSPCPGVCIYAQVFDGVDDLGFICFDCTLERIEFRNNAVTHIFGSFLDQDDYGFLFSLFLSKIEGLQILSNSSRAQSVKHADKILGYTVYPMSSGRFVWIFVRDITDKLRLESIAEAVNSMNNLGYVFSGIRHEIGNPINSAKMALSVLREEFDDLSKEETFEFIDRALGELLRVEFLLKNLRNINMHEIPDIEKVDITVFLEHFVSLTLEDSSKKGIHIKTDFQCDSQWGYVDPRPLQQVLLNVFTNAIDALVSQELPSSAEALKCQDLPTIVVSTICEKGFLWIKVTDNGCGIPDKDIGDVFKPFFTSKHHGTGLGLVLCRKMLASMNCTIEIKSKQGSGTTVSISIPEVLRESQ